MTARTTGSDFLHLDPSAAPPGGLTTWLAGAVRTAIADGRLPPGTRLPATRTLAADLGLSRGVVVEAYRRLADEGIVGGRPGAGTTVLRLGLPSRSTPPGTPGHDGTARPGDAFGPPTTSHQATTTGHQAPTTGHQAPTTGRPRGSPGATPLRLPRLPADTRHAIALDLSPGVPDLASFPRTAWLRAERAVLDRASVADLGYGDPRGAPRLRAELAGWLARTRGLRATADEVLVVAGVAQSLALLAQTLRAGGATTIAVEDPGSRGARDELTHWGLVPTPVPVDEQGLDVRALVAGSCPAVLVTPAHQFPTGVVLAPHRRRALASWAVGGGLVVEDDYDAEHRYDRAPVPALQGAMPDHVAHAGSTSKSLAPGMRLGWLVAPRRFHDDLVAAKHASDLGSPAVPQLTLAHLLASGAYDRHLRLVRRRLRDRRDAMLAAVRRHLPRAEVAGVAAGLHLLVTLPELAGRVGDADLAHRLEEVGVLVQPLSWHRHAPGPPGLVLGYAAHSADRLWEAVRRVGEVVRRAAETGPPPRPGRTCEATTAPSASTRPVS